MIAKYQDEKSKLTSDYHRTALVIQRTETLRLNLVEALIGENRLRSNMSNRIMPRLSGNVPEIVCQ